MKQAEEAYLKPLKFVTFLRGKCAISEKTDNMALDKLQWRSRHLVGGLFEVDKCDVAVESQYKK